MAERVLARSGADCVLAEADQTAAGVDLPVGFTVDADALGHDLAFDLAAGGDHELGLTGQGHLALDAAHHDKVAREGGSLS